jgi:hypothetical protein
MPELIRILAATLLQGKTSMLDDDAHHRAARMAVSRPTTPDFQSRTAITKPDPQHSVTVVQSCNLCSWAMRLLTRSC